MLLYAEHWFIFDDLISKTINIRIFVCVNGKVTIIVSVNCEGFMHGFMCMELLFECVLHNVELLFECVLQCECQLKLATVVCLQIYYVISERSAQWLYVIRTYFVCKC